MQQELLSFASFRRQNRQKMQKTILSSTDNLSKCSKETSINLAFGILIKDNLLHKEGGGRQQEEENISVLNYFLNKGHSARANSERATHLSQTLVEVNQAQKNLGCFICVLIRP